MFNLDVIPYEEKIYKKRIKKVNGSARKGKENINKSYDLLIKHIEKYSQLEKLWPLPFIIQNYKCDDWHNIFYNFYDKDTKDFLALKKEIKDKTKNNQYSKQGLKCSYCGISRHRLADLDHFMPRSKYSEFSILSCNLIYVCKQCNQDYKKSKFLDKNGVRQFLHPYYDMELNSTQILECNIEINNIFLNITFRVREELEEENKYLYLIALNHLKELKLDIRYTELVREDLIHKFLNKFRDEEYSKGRKIQELSVESCKNYIQDKIDELKDDVTCNDFEIIFWKELFHCTDWFENISEKIL